NHEWTRMETVKWVKRVNWGRRKWQIYRDLHKFSRNRLSQEGNRGSKADRCMQLNHNGLGVSWNGTRSLLVHQEEREGCGSSASQLFASLLKISQRFA